MKKPNKSEASTLQRSSRIARSGIVLEMSAVLIMMAAPAFAYLVCLLFWGSEFQKLDEARLKLQSGTATAFDIGSFESTVIRLRFVPIILFVMWRSGESWSSFGLVKPRYGKDILIGVCLWLVVETLYRSISLAFNRHVPGLLDFRAAVPLVRAVLLIGQSCAVGFSEELAMRAYLIPRCEALTGSTSKSILFSVLVFGFVHLHKSWFGVIHSMVSASVWGIGFCLTRRIWPVAISHAFNDVIANAHLGATIGV